MADERLLIRDASLYGERTDILIEDGKIAALGKDLDGGTCPAFDAAGRVAVAGLTDCHLHMDKALLAERAAYVDGTGAEKGALTREQKKDFTVADITDRAERIIKRCIAAGTLNARTNVDVDAIVGLKGIEALLALREKYRGVLNLQIAAFAQEGIFQDGKTPELLEEALKMGADLVGGHTITCGEGEKHIDFILALAEKYGVCADFHLDESGNREHYLLPYTARKVSELGLQGRVNAIHLCTLSALTPEERAEGIALAAGAGMTVTVAPTAISTRKIAPVKELLAAGLRVGLGSDNIRDFFNPLGSGDVKQMALLLAYLQRFFTAGEVAQLWDMLTEGGASVLGADAAVRVGAKADLTVFDAPTPAGVIADTARPVLLIRSGRRLPLQ